jgi:hypothetical protein
MPFAGCRSGLPTVFGYREHVVEGGLISYGVDLRWPYRRATYFAVKILRGAALGDLPIEFPTYSSAVGRLVQRPVSDEACGFKASLKVG